MILKGVRRRPKLLTLNLVCYTSQLAQKVVALSRFSLLRLPLRTPSESLMLGLSCSVGSCRIRGLVSGLGFTAGVDFASWGWIASFGLFADGFLTLEVAVDGPDKLDSGLLLESWLWKSWLRPGASSSSSLLLLLFCFFFLPRCFAVCSSSSSSSLCSCSLSSFLRLFPDPPHIWPS